MTCGMFDKRIPVQEQPNVLVFVMFRTLIKLNIIDKNVKWQYVTENGNSRTMNFSSFKIGHSLRHRWKKQGWYRFEHKQKG